MTSVKRRKLDPISRVPPKPQAMAMDELKNPSSASRISRTFQALETLPTEVIHQIFTHCLNPSLPATSLPLCRNLTGLQQLQRTLFLHAFHPSVVSASTKPLLPRSLNGQLHYSDKAQSQLFRLRWFTYAFINATLAEYNVRVPFWLRSHARVTMPSKVLHSPWDEDKLALLNLLLRSHASIEPPNRDIASASFRSACRDNDLPVLQALVWKDYWMHTDDVPEEEANAEGIYCISVACMKIFIAGDNDVDRSRPDLSVRGGTMSTSGSWSEGVKPDTVHLRAAIPEGGAQRKVLEVLWAAKEHSMDMWDDGIWHWIREMEAEGDERAKWLPEQLEKWNKKHPPNVNCLCDDCKTDDRRRVPGLRNSRLESQENV